MLDRKTIQNTMDALAIKRWGIISMDQKTRAYLKERGHFSVPNSVLTYDEASEYSILTIAIPYALEGDEKPKGHFWGEIDPYAWEYDYHVKVKALLTQVWTALNPQRDALDDSLCDAHVEAPSMYVDNTPFNDREVAFLCGMGLIGYNHLLIEEASALGTAFFIGYMLIPSEVEICEDAKFDVTTLPQEVENPFCKTCQKCVKACPTGVCGDASANMNLCMSAISQTKAHIQEPFRLKMKDKIYGCNICQKVCPFNASNVLTYDSKARERNWVDLLKLLELNTKSFKQQYGHMGFAWKSLWIYKRNALIVLGNQGGREELEYLLTHAQNFNQEPLLEYYKFATNRMQARLSVEK